MNVAYTLVFFAKPTPKIFSPMSIIEIVLKIDPYSDDGSRVLKSIYSSK